jgi:hypothetical protein
MENVKIDDLNLADIRRDARDRILDVIVAQHLEAALRAAQVSARKVQRFKLREYSQQQAGT